MRLAMNGAVLTASGCMVGYSDTIADRIPSEWRVIRPQNEIQIFRNADPAKTRSRAGLLEAGRRLEVRAESQ